ncbi:MAG: hypothetical protein ABWZ75_10620 [Novosphingobium sp.]
MSVSGTYDIVTKTPMGDQKGTFVVNADGDSFTGSVSSAMMGTMEVSGGKVSGNTLTWTMDMKVPMPMTLEGTATVDGDAITGEVSAGSLGSRALWVPRAA